MTTTTLCPMCQNLVPTDRVHSCYDARAVVALRDAERAVIDAAVAYVDANNADRTTLGEVFRSLVAIQRAVKALRALTTPEGA